MFSSRIINEDRGSSVSISDLQNIFHEGPCILKVSLGFHYQYAIEQLPRISKYSMLQKLKTNRHLRKIGNCLWICFNGKPQVAQPLFQVVNVHTELSGSQFQMPECLSVFLESMPNVYLS